MKRTKETSRIILLDIDGVCCTLRAQYAFGTRLLMEEWDITVCQMLRRLCEKHDLKIVISSVWRKDKDQCWHHIMFYGMWHYMHEDWRTPINKHGNIRGKDISQWLKKHPEVTDYVIVDDDKDFYKHQMRRLIHVKDRHNGFGWEEYQAVDKWFSRKRRKFGSKT